MTSINIERLTPATLIFRKDDADFGPYGDFAEVQECEFDGHDYVVTARFLESNGARSWVGDLEVTFIVEPGETVEYGGVNAPRLRDKSVIGKDEWDAKFAADMAATGAMISEANAKCADMRGDGFKVAAE